MNIYMVNIVDDEKISAEYWSNAYFMSVICGTKPIYRNKNKILKFTIFMEMGEKHVAAYKYTLSDNAYKFESRSLIEVTKCDDEI